MNNTSSKIQRSDILSVIAFVMLALAACPAVAGQSLTVDTPTDLERARTKAEKAWTAWEAQGHIEGKLLKLPADRALTEIRQDGRLAEEYLSARQVQVKLLSDDFRRRATALELAATSRPDLSKLQKAEEQNLAALIEGDLNTSSELAKTDKDSDPGRREAKRQAVARESASYKQLADDARKRLEVLQLSARSDERFGENERALIDTLRRLSATLDEQGAAIAQEREDWQTYHKHLEDLVVGRANGPATPKTDLRVGEPDPARSPLKSK